MTEEQWLNEGYTHYMADRYQEALNAFEQVLRLNPNSAPAYEYKGYALRSLQRYGEARTAHERAVALYEKALQLNPNDATNYSNKASCLLMLERFGEALAVIEQAIRLAPQNAFYYESKAWILLKLNRIDDAYAALKQVNRLDPSRDRIEELLRRVEKSEKAQPRYWVMRREASDAGPGGYYRRQQKYAGPFATKTEALAKAQELNDEQRRSISDERLDKAMRRALFEARINYWPMSEDEMEEARRNGTSIY